MCHPSSGCCRGLPAVLLPPLWPSSVYPMHGGQGALKTQKSHHSSPLLHTLPLHSFLVTLEPNPKALLRTRRPLPAAAPTSHHPALEHTPLLVSRSLSALNAEHTFHSSLLKGFGLIQISTLLPQLSALGSGSRLAETISVIPSPAHSMLRHRHVL